MNTEHVNIPADYDQRRYARAALPWLRRRVNAIRCTCPTCTGVDYLRVEDYRAAHPTNAGWDEYRGPKQ
jgi:hypothetical protein